MAQNDTPVTVSTSTPTLIWQTSTGVAPDPETTLAGGNTAQIYRAGTSNDPVPIVIQNLDGTNPITLGGANVTAGNGTELVAGGSLTRNIVGNDSEYALAAGAPVKVSVEVGRQ